ncbi:MAG: phosphate ABC transporter permease PstA [Geminicoccaceae bacterium]
MTDRADAQVAESTVKVVRLSAEASAARTKQRYAAEARFKMIGLIAVCIAVGMLVILLGSIVTKGMSAFTQTHIALDVYFDPEELAPEGEATPQSLRNANYASLVNDALYALFPEVEGRTDQRALRNLMSSGAALQLRDMVRDDPSLVGTTQTIDLIASDDIDQVVKGVIDTTVDESNRRVKDRDLAWLDTLREQDRVSRPFNTGLLFKGDSREPEMAGIWGAVMGSFYMMLIVLCLAVPIGVASAVYLEEFAPKNRLTDFIEVNINNLAAVPSIVFGLLGLAVFIQVFGVPRSAPLAGGLTLTLMTLPTIVVATRAALRGVPPSIRQGALGVGASKIQVVGHHVLPLALPGILTGTIIGLAQALGETAPLLMIGMIAFIADIPGGILDPATALPVQVYLWAESAERAFVERTSAAIMVLLAFLLVMNALAVYMRRRFERKW